MSNTLGDMGVAAGLAGGVGDFGGGVGARSSGCGELASDGAGKNNGVVVPCTAVGSAIGDTGAGETVETGSGAGDTVAAGSSAGDMVAVGSGAGGTAAAGSGADEAAAGESDEGETGADMFDLNVVVEEKEGNIKVPLSHTTGVRSGV